MADKSRKQQNKKRLRGKRQTLRRSFGNAWEGILVCFFEESVLVHLVHSPVHLVETVRFIE